MERHSSTEVRMIWREVQDLVNRGEPIIITRHGEEVACLVPLRVDSQGLVSSVDARELSAKLGPLLARANSYRD